MTTARRAASFEEFVVATGDRMLRTAVLLTGDRHAAEDLVQSAYAQAFARWRLVARADNPTAYTRAILTRLFLSDRRRKRVRELPLLAGADAPATTTDPALRLSLVEALATLPPTDRAVLVLRYFHDLPVAEVADQVGLSESACRTRASRALARLRTHFPDLADQA
ncbi:MULTISPECIES: SigE family RNA polymerase sigma factor [unclassified Nocardioides]|uniref:SigE family RNA polymerase sigma factor n=1 Tax=unclassified Nocardioides TaxID=2615069 RepID=UPI000AE87653|nr:MULTISPECIES: SigE family RNA polymerase sigma factor [unclassified Nocardioides]